ncbi:YlxR family protein [Jiangella rhizosphaerae]|uniref:Uncharacterized protein n=1 Tax=Jiangella rhizosphaerae TaxID=2293569 RepID=A0A418KQ54_9ACTN|nr:hypothetical protein [Jiangella rhizosphaerae]RIQ22068.1 hypothetical protein DY240_14175 [Jiangella rhizosphaerae]
MGDPEQPPHVRQWRDVLNRHVPDDPASYPDRPHPRRVRVRVVWADQDGVVGEAWLAGTLTRWGGTHRYVQLDDTAGRLPGRGVWVKPDDVYQSEPINPAGV